jgi:hypothetical protein
MAKSPKFEMLLHEMRELHSLKNADYAQENNAFSNFEEAAQVAAGFEGTDAVFATLIGIKLARLRELTRAKKTPNNESIADTRKDLAMYAALWAAHALPFSYDDSRLWHNGGEAKAKAACSAPFCGGFCCADGLKELAANLSVEDDGA